MKFFRILSKEFYLHLQRDNAGESMKLKGLIFIFVFTMVQWGYPGVYRTKVFAPNIKTFTVGIAGEKYSLPHIALNSHEMLEIRFDEMSHETRAFSYKLIHCNADWTQSELATTEFLEGFTHADISQSERSVNTSYLYTHYHFQLPNEELRFRVSGNYVVQIYQDNQQDKPVAQACFSVYEPKAGIEAMVRPNTDTEINGRYQQLDFVVNLSGYYVREPMNEIKVTVRQNNRFDTEVTNLSPTSLTSSKLSFTNNKALIFEGGSEFRSFDISSVYAAGRGVEEVTLKNKQFEAWLTTDKVRRGKYEFDFDVNGRFLIHHQEAFNDVDTEADYLPVHFSLDAPHPFFDGMLYLGGEMVYNLMDQNNRMNYNNQRKRYEQTILLKQGGYNYQYRFVPKGQNVASVMRTEGSYWQTRNEYTIYVYHRPWGERYDKLIGIRTVTNSGME